MRDAVTVVVSASGQVGHHGHARRAPLDPVERGAKSLRGRRHQWRVKGGADVERNHTLRTRQLQALCRDLETCDGAGDHGLGRRVVVGGPRIAHAREDLNGKV